MVNDDAGDGVNEKVIATLNGLIETCKNGEEGFRTAAEALSDQDLKVAFAKIARARWQMARELQDEVQGLGGQPETSGTVGGAVHRGWMNVKALVAGQDDQALIAEAERGEDIAKAAYESALQEALPAQVLALVERQALQVRATHDQVRAMLKSAPRS
ncbi:MAG: PA2169 family four-helix-bundle protein [Acidobacteriota bacterium]|nr:PA2169 family four-helix-bundle protein [Acidobacteriota bacterium]